MDDPGAMGAKRRAIHADVRESFEIAVLLASRAITAAAELVGLGWEALHGIMERAVERGISGRDLEGLRYLGLDEKSFQNGQDYITVMSDLEGGRVLEVVEGKDAEGGEILLETLPEPVQENIKAVAMDMSLGLEAAVRKILGGADIVHDRYHISSNLAEAVDKVRRKENKALQAEGERHAQRHAATVAHGAPKHECRTSRELRSDPKRSHQSEPSTRDKRSVRRVLEK